MKTKKTGSVRALGLIFCAIALSFSSLARASVTVGAEVDRTAMDPGDTFELRVTVNTDEDGTPAISQAPDIAGFEVVNQGMSTSARAGIVGNGGKQEFKRTTSYVYSYFYQAQQEGKFKIPSIEVKFNDKSYNTSAINVTVARGASQNTKQNAKPRKQAQPGGAPPDPWGGDQQDEVEDLFNQLLQRHGLPVPNGGGSGNGSGGYRSEPVNPQDAFFVQLELDKTDVFVGEQVTASWYLYTRGVIRDLDTLKYPDLRGFWKEDIEIATNLNFTQEIVNGVPYRKALLASYALFPIKEGQTLVDSYKAKCSVIAGDMFGFGGGKAYTYTKASKEVKINVRPLPVAGRPSDFSGAVGTYIVSSKIEDNNIVTNQPFSFHIRFEGKGNAKLIDLPPLDLPTGIELYDTQKEAKFFKNGNSYKDFNLQLIARNEGDFVVPAVSVSMFDPESKNFVTRKTEPIKIHVLRGATDPNVKNAPLVGGTQQAAPPAEFKAVIDTDFHAARIPNRTLQLVIYLLVIVTMAIVLLLKASSELGWGEKKKNLLKQMRWRFKKVGAKVGKSPYRETAIDATNAMYFILGQLSGEGGASLEIEKLLLLIPPSVRGELGSDLTKCIEKLQVLSFAPEDVVGNLKDPAETKKLISDLQRILEKAVVLATISEPAGASAKAQLTS